jgi:hypothetical protein
MVTDERKTRRDAKTGQPSDVRPVQWASVERRPQTVDWARRRGEEVVRPVVFEHRAPSVEAPPPTMMQATAPPASEGTAQRPMVDLPEPELTEAAGLGAEPGPSSAGQALPEGMMLVSEEMIAQREDAIVEALRTPYLEAATKLMAAADELESRLRDDVVELAARIAQALVHRELRTDRSVVLEVAQRALRLVGPLERLTVRCAPEDADLLRENLPGLARVEVGRVVEVLVRPSDDILPGGLVLTFEGGVVDAREERRLARLVEAVKMALRDAELGQDAHRGGR